MLATVDAPAILVEARGSLATATTMFREMAMRFWLEQAAAELKELA